MGCGIVVQLLTSNFPYPAQWLKIIGYIFWILDICLFALFTALEIARAWMFPKALKSTLQDVQQTCYWGTMVVAWETIGTGIVIFYSSHKSAAYVAEVFFWIAVAMALLVACGGIYAVYQHQGQHTLDDVNGAWFLLFIPQIVAAAYGSNLANALPHRNAIAVIAVSYLMLASGLGLSFLLLGIYVWRLLNCHLPPRASIVSTFVPVGPLGMSAYAFVNLSAALSKQVRQGNFGFRQSWETPLSAATLDAVAEMLIWIGVIGALFLLGMASFFLVEAVAAIITTVPKTFNIGHWSFVFPCGVYANAFCKISILLRNDGMKGWATACVVGVVLLWLMCAILTTYKAVIQGKLFFAPGLQGWVEEKELKSYSKAKESSEDTVLDEIQAPQQANAGQGRGLRRRPQNDGSYTHNTNDSGNSDPV